MNDLKTGPWNLTDLKNIKKNGCKVLSTFSCGGGSTMGYKLAGFEVIGAVEIDKEMATIYKKNHHPKYLYNMPIAEFNKLENLPEEFFDLDILDGSPPCSSFSMAGSREKKWGKARKFREGQAVQVLDDLFFDFIKTTKKLQPKIVVAENVKGLIQGKARGYVKEIFEGFREAGYSCQLFLLNSAFMGVPQRRERTFFIANKLNKKINLSDKFNETPIKISDAISNVRKPINIKWLTDESKKLWSKTKPGDSFAKAHPLGHRFNEIIAHPNEPLHTLNATSDPLHWLEPRRFHDFELLRAQTFPDDYESINVGYICGMSVPPFMMQRIADQIYRQLLLSSMSSTP
jgi:DNA (cytosine-5)-methyltransferase 1